MVISKNQVEPKSKSLTKKIWESYIINKNGEFIRKRLRLDYKGDLINQNWDVNQQKLEFDRQKWWI